MITTKSGGVIHVHKRYTAFGRLFDGLRRTLPVSHLLLSSLFVSFASYFILPVSLSIFHSSTHPRMHPPHCIGDAPASILYFQPSSYSEACMGTVHIIKTWVGAAVCGKLQSSLLRPIHSFFHSLTALRVSPSFLHLLPSPAHRSLLSRWQMPTQSFTHRLPFPRPLSWRLTSLELSPACSALCPGGRRMVYISSRR